MSTPLSRMYRFGIPGPALEGALHLLKIMAEAKIAAG